MVTEVETVENVLHTSNSLKLLDVFLIGAPGLRKLMLDPLESPEEIEYLFIAFHYFISEDRRERGQILHTIVEHENFPPLVPRGRLQQLDLKSGQEVRVMILCITLPDCPLKMSLQGVLVDL